MRESRICVILLNRHLSNTLPCLDSLSKVSYTKFTTFVVDDGSNPDAVATIRTKHPETLIERGTSANTGIEWALTKPFQWILLLSNEAIVDPLCLSAFMAQAIVSPDAKIFGAKILQHGQIAHLGGRWNAITATCESLTTDCESQIVDYVSSKACLIHHGVPERIGLLEPKYRVSWEDIDFCFRARRKGFLTRTAPHAKIWHNKLDHSSLRQDRLLWIKRNLIQTEREDIYKRIIRPERRKMLREFLSHAISRLLFRPILK